MNDYEVFIQLSLYLFIFLLLTFDFFRGFQARAQAGFFIAAIKHAIDGEEKSEKLFN